MKTHLRPLVFLPLVSLLALSLTGCGGDADAQISFNGDDPDVVIVTCDTTNLLLLASSPSDFLGNRLQDTCSEVIEDLLKDENLRIEAVTALEESGRGILVYTLLNQDLL